MKINTLNFNIIVVLFLVGLLGCDRKMDQAGFINWVEDQSNGLHKKKEVGQYLFEVQYKPAAYRILKSTNTISNRETWNEKMKDYSQLQHYTLTIGLSDETKDLIAWDTKDKALQQEKIYYFSYKLQDHIYLEENGKKLPCQLLHFERSYNLKSSRTFVLAFDQLDDVGKDAKLVIDSPLFQTGPVKVRINKENIPVYRL